MPHTRDKLGEFILIAEDFNRYEPFAAKAANYCRLDQEHPADSFPGEFALRREPTASMERRMLVHSDHVYGARRPIAQAIFDVAHATSSWTVTGSTGGSAPVPQSHYQWRFGLAVRPVLDDFDPADLSWDDAYVAGGGFAFGDEVVSETLCLDGVVGCQPQDFPSPNNEPPRAQADVLLSGEWPGLLAIKLSNSSALWNSEEAIYGFEIRMATWAGSASPAIASWTGDVSRTDSVCYVIRR